MKTSSTLFIWGGIIMIILTTISDYHAYTTLLAVNNKLQEVGKTDLIKEAKFPSDIGQYLLWVAFIVFGIAKKYFNKNEF
jgi:hypothetical protein